MSKSAAGGTGGEPRWADKEQPAPLFDEKASRGQKFRVVAVVHRRGTGKAEGSVVTERRRFCASTAEEAVRQRGEFIEKFLNPSKRKVCQVVVEAVQDESNISSKRRLHRASKPHCLAEPKLQPTVPIRQRAGPGRGRRYEPARPIGEQIAEEPVILPPADAEDGSCWLRRMQLKEKWKSERIAQLERQVEKLIAENSRQAQTINALREKVRRAG